MLFGVNGVMIVLDLCSRFDWGKWVRSDGPCTNSYSVFYSLWNDAPASSWKLRVIILEPVPALGTVDCQY